MGLSRSDWPSGYLAVDEKADLCRLVGVGESVSVILRGAGCSRGRGLSVAVDLALVLEGDCGLYGDHRGGRVVLESESARDLQSVSWKNLAKKWRSTNRILVDGREYPLCGADHRADHLAWNLAPLFEFE